MTEPHILSLEPYKHVNKNIDDLSISEKIVSVKFKNDDNCYDLPSQTHFVSDSRMGSWLTFCLYDAEGRVMRDDKTDLSTYDATRDLEDGIRYYKSGDHQDYIDFKMVQTSTYYKLLTLT